MTFQLPLQLIQLRRAAFDGLGPILVTTILQRLADAPETFQEIAVELRQPLPCRHTTLLSHGRRTKRNDTTYHAIGHQRQNPQQRMEAANDQRHGQGHQHGNADGGDGMGVEHLQQFNR